MSLKSLESLRTGCGDLQLPKLGGFIVPIGKTALTYNLIPSEDEIDHTLNYLEEAYALSKRIITTRNLSWYLFSKWGDSTRSIEIQREWIRFKPPSYDLAAC